MTQQELLTAYAEHNGVLNNSESLAIDRLKAKKEVVLAELESAYLTILHDRTRQELKRAVERAKFPEKKEKEKIKEQYRPRRETLKENYLFRENIVNFVQKEEIEYSSSFGNSPFSRKISQEDLGETQISNQALSIAQKAVRQNMDLARFRKRLNQLESSGSSQDLEAILNATHNVAVCNSPLAEDFVSAFEAVPTLDQAVYAHIVTRLFPNTTDPMGGNPLIMRLSRLRQTPSIPTFQIQEQESPFFKIDEIRKSFLEDDSPKRIYLKKYFRKGPLPNPEKYTFDLVDKINIDKEEIPPHGFGGLKDLQIIPEDKESSITHSPLLFFEEVRTFGKALGQDNLSFWLRSAEQIFDENEKRGRDFVMGSRSSAVAYLKNLGMDLPTFVGDYRKHGASMFVASDFQDKYCDMPRERRKSILREALDNENLSLIKELAENRMPRRAVSFTLSSLPKDTSNEDLISSFREMSALYKTAEGGERLVERAIFRLPKFKGIEDLTTWVKQEKEKAKAFLEFAKEQTQNADMNLGFNTAAAIETFELYETLMGKNLTQFKRDFEATGSNIQKLPDIAKRYGSYLGETQTRAFMNYVAKQRSRDLIGDLSISAPETLTRDFLTKIKSSGKEETVKSLREFNRTYQFLQDLDATILAQLENELIPKEERANSKVGLEGILDKVILALPESASSEQTIPALKSLRRKVYAPITGDLEVPRELEALVDNVVTAYYKNTGTSERVEIKPALSLIVQSYLKEGAEGAYRVIREQEANKRLAKILTRKGINLKAFQTGQSRTYEVATDEGSLQRARERIESEMNQVWDRLAKLYTPKEDEKEADEETLQNREKLKTEIEAMKQGTLREQLSSAEEFLSSYKFDEQTKPLRQEVKGHVQTAKSITGSMKSMSAQTTFYVSQDPLESLHMGQYFSSCLSLAKNHGGCNGWAAVVQTMDANKNVIYARTADGKYVGRNRTALTDKGIICTRFYQNGNMNLNDAWIDYLGEFANYTGQEIMIPKKFVEQSQMTPILEKMLAEGKVSKEQRTLRIAPAYYSAFYGDGLSIKGGIGGGMHLDQTEVYILKPSSEGQPAKPEKGGALSRLFS
jgi:hypothetical protein